MLRHRVGELLDDDLNTPGAIEAIDRAAGDGIDVSDAAGLFGVELNDYAATAA